MSAQDYHELWKNLRLKIVQVAVFSDPARLKALADVTNWMDELENPGSFGDDFFNADGTNNFD